MRMKSCVGVACVGALMGVQPWTLGGEGVRGVGVVPPRGASDGVCELDIVSTTAQDVKKWWKGWWRCVRWTLDLYER